MKQKYVYLALNVNKTFLNKIVSVFVDYVLMERKFM